MPAPRRMIVLVGRDSSGHAVPEGAQVALCGTAVTSTTSTRLAGLRGVAVPRLQPRGGIEGLDGAAATMRSAKRSGGK